MLVECNELAASFSLLCNVLVAGLAVGTADLVRLAEHAFHIAPGHPRSYLFLQHRLAPLLADDPIAAAILSFPNYFYFPGLLGLFLPCASRDPFHLRRWQKRLAVLHGFDSFPYFHQFVIGAAQLGEGDVPVRVLAAVDGGHQRRAFESDIKQKRQGAERGAHGDVLRDGSFRRYLL